MNQAQLTSLVKQGLNGLAGFLAAHGYASAGTLINTQTVASGIVLAGVWIYSHFFQHTDVNEATPTPMPKTGVTMPPIAALLLCAGLGGALMVGCSSFNANVFNSEKIAADLGRNSVHGFNVYYAQATNGATPQQLEKLNSTRDSIYAGSAELAHALTVTEGLRKSYAINSADTNKTALQIAVAVAESQANNIWTNVQFITGGKLILPSK